MMMAFQNIYLCQVIYVFSFNFYINTRRKRADVHLILHIRKLKPENIRLFVYGYTPGKQQNHELSLVLKLNAYRFMIINGGKGEKNGQEKNFFLLAGEEKRKHRARENRFYYSICLALKYLLLNSHLAIGEKLSCLLQWCV